MNRPAEFFQPRLGDRRFSRRQLAAIEVFAQLMLFGLKIT
jgi:hypothetical protein